MLNKILFGIWLVLIGVVVATVGIVQSGRQAFGITLDYWYSWQFISSRALVIYTLAAPLIPVIRFRIEWGKRQNPSIEKEYAVVKARY